VLTLKIVWAFIKKYWGIIALVVGAIIGILFFRQRQTSFGEQLKQIQDNHSAEIAAIKKAKNEEIAKHKANEAQLQKLLKSIEKQYVAQQQQLDAKKRAEVVQIVKKYGDDPVALANRLSESTGFKVILPTK